MTAVVSVRGPSGVGTTTPTSGGGRSAGTSLLPGAEPPTLGQLQGAMAGLYMIMSQLRDAQSAQSMARVDSAKLGREIAERQHEEAMKRAREAAEKGGLFDWLSKDIGLAGVVGLVTFNYALVAADITARKVDLVDNLKVDVIDVGAVATGRYDVLAADILLRKTELAPKEARELLEKCGLPKDAPGISDEDVRPIARKVLMANLFIVSCAATVLSAGTTTGVCIALAGLAISMAGSQVAEHKVLDGVFGKGSSKWIGLGLQIYGAAASGMSGLAKGAAIGAGAKAAAAVSQGAVTSLRAADKMAIAVHEKERDDANVDAESARMQLARLERVIDQLIDAIKEVSECSRRTGEALQGAISAADQSQLALANGTRV